MSQRKKIIGSFALLSALVIFSLAYIHVAAQSALPVQNPAPLSAHLITKASFGPVRIGMTLAQARRAMPGVVFKRSDYFDAGAEFTLLRSNTKLMNLYFSNFYKEDINGSHRQVKEQAMIDSIEALDASYSTAAGVHPKMLLREAEQRYGKVSYISTDNFDETGRGESAKFTRSPDGLTFSVEAEGKEYAGIYKNKNTSGEESTTRYVPSARIRSIWIMREGE